MLDFTSITRVSNLTQTMKLQQSWEKKQPIGGNASLGQPQKKKPAAPDLSQYHSQAGKDLAMKKYSEQLLIDQFQENQKNGKTDEKLSSIMTKVQSGSDLSYDEMEYLKDKNPTVYQKLKEEEADREAFEKRIKQAKTKDEVQQIRTDHSMKAMTTVNAVKNNPYITDSDKAAIMGSEVRMERKASEILQKFVESGEYGKLPTQAEKNEAEKEIREAKEREMQEQAQPMTEEAESTEKPEDAPEESKDPVTEQITENPKAHENTGAPGTNSKEKSLGETKETDADTAKQKVSFESKKEQHQSVKEAESSPEALKLKNAKRKKPEVTKKRQHEALNIQMTSSVSAGSAAPNVGGTSGGFDLSV